MKKNAHMKKIASIVFTMIIVFSSFFYNGLQVHASGWLDTADNIDLNTSYSVCPGPNDYTAEEGFNTVRYDAYKFTVPANGSITINTELPEEGYTGYYLWHYYIYNSNSTDSSICDWTTDYKFDGSIGKNVASVSYNLSAGTYYLVHRTIYNLYNYNVPYDLRIDYKPDLGKATIKKVKARKKGLTVTWRKAAYASGYEIRCSRKKSMKSSKVYRVSSFSSSKKISKLSKKKKYYVQVRAYRDVVVNGETIRYVSSWSKKKSVKTK